MTSTNAIKKLISIASVSAAKIRKIGVPLWNILTLNANNDLISPKNNICIAIEHSDVSISYGSRFLSRIKIKGFKKYPVSDKKYPQPDELASTAVLAMKDIGVSNKDVTLSIPKAWTILKTAVFPSTVKENIADVISYELDRLTPFKQEDALYDFKTIGENGNNLTVLLAAAKAEKISPYIDALREQNIQVNRVAINLSGIGTLCHYMYKDGSFVFVKINEDGYEGAIFLSGFMAEAFTGSFSESDESSKVDAIAESIKSFKDMFKGQGKTPQCIILVNDKSTALKEMLKLRIDIPVSMLDETDLKVRINGNLKYASYTAIGGVLESVWPKAKGLDLLKKGYTEKVKNPKALTIILICIIFALGVFYVLSPVQTEGKRLKEIDHQIAIRKDEIKKVEAVKQNIDAIKTEISTINGFKEGKPSSLIILKELTAILPDTDWLTRLKISDSSVNIEGYSESATRLLQKLEASKYFKKVEFVSPTFRDVRLNSERFSMKMEIEGIKEHIKPVPTEEFENEE